MDITDDYIAGFFDGEGTIQIYMGKRVIKGKMYMRCQLSVAITQLDPKPLYLIMERYGGNVYQRKSRATKSGKMHNRFDWVATSLVATEFLEAITPWLIVKQEEALIALEFSETLATNLDDTRNGIPPETLEKRWELHDEIREVRKRKTDIAYAA